MLGAANSKSVFIRDIRVICDSDTKVGGRYARSDLQIFMTVYQLEMVKPMEILEGIGKVATDARYGVLT